MKPHNLFSIAIVLLLGILLIAHPVHAWPGDDSNTVSLLYLNGTQGSTVMNDEIANVWANGGTITIDTAIFKFGGGSALSTAAQGANTHYLSNVSPVNLSLPGPFTWEMWVNLTAYNSNYNCLICYAATNREAWAISDTGAIKIWNGAAYTTPGYTVNLSQQTHLALIRTGTTMQFYADGVPTGSSWTDSRAITPTAVYIAGGDANFYSLRGHFDQVRISNVSRWSVHFTPPPYEYNHTTVSAPVASFTAPATVGTVNWDLTLTDTSSNTPTSWYWELANSTGHQVSTLKNPVFNVSFADQYILNMTATNGGGSGSSNNTVVLSRNPAPVARFDQANLNWTNTTTSLTFTDTSTGTNITQWIWDVENHNHGNISTSQNPSYQFACNTADITNADNCLYNMSHLVNDSAGTVWNVSSTWWNQSNWVTIYQNSSPTFSFTGTPTSGTNPLSVSFTVTPAGTIKIDSYQWIFGDGLTTSTTFPTVNKQYVAAGQFSVTLNAWNWTLGNATVTKEKYITVSNPAPVVNIPTVSPRNWTNTTTTLTFTDSSSGTNITAWSWEWLPENNASTTQNPVRTFPCNTGPSCLFDMNHSAVDSDGTPWSITTWRNRTEWITIYANSSPTVTFVEDAVGGQVPHTVHFTPTQVGAIKIDSWSWDFGDGNTSTIQDPANTYGWASQFTVTLTATNYTLGTTTVTQTNVITVYNQPPIVAFTNAPPFGNSSTVFSFTDGSMATNTSFGSPSYLWDFGDGNASVLKDPTYSYPTPSSDSQAFTVTEFVTDSPGTPWDMSNSTTKTDLITIYKNASPTASFTGAPLSGQRPLDVQFNATPAGAIGVDSWAWSFGDGNTSSVRNASNTFPGVGQYSVTLTATNRTLGQTVVSKTDYVTVSNPPPTVGWSNVPSYANATTAIQFTDSSTGTNLTAGSHFWDFNDGNTTTTQDPAHAFPCNTGAACSYTINKSTTDSPGTHWAVASWLNRTGWVAVYADLAPTTTFTEDIAIGTVPFTVTFNGTSYGAIAIDSWRWDFGDTGAASGQNATHQYAQAGQYTVTLTATNYTLGESQTIKPNDILAQNPQPVADFTGSPLFGNTTTVIQFTDASTGTNVTGWDWDFGDGTTSTLQDPTYAYSGATADTLYSVTLTAKDSLGTPWETASVPLTKTDYVMIFVEPGPTYTIEEDATTGIAPFTVNFTARRVGAMWADSFQWDFGDTGTSSLQNPAHQYTQGGLYSVTLTATNYTLGQTTVMTGHVLNAAIPHDSGRSIQWMCRYNLTNCVNHGYYDPDTGNPVWVGDYGTRTGIYYSTEDIGYPSFTFRSGDTIPASAWIMAANFSVAVLDPNDYGEYLPPTNALTINLSHNTADNYPHDPFLYPDSDGRALGNDYDIYNYIEPQGSTNGGSVAGTDLVGNAYNNITMTPEGLGWIGKGAGGTTNITLLTSDFIDHQSSRTGNDWITIYPEYPMVSPDPHHYLYITYEIPPILVHNPAPVAVANATPSTANQTVDVYFVDSSTGTNITAWSWDFQDGNTSAAMNITNRFPTPKTYYVVHTVTDSAGTPWAVVSSVEYIPVTIVNNSAGGDFAGTPMVGTVPFWVHFTWTGTGGPEENYTWSFGEGNTSTAGPDIWHLYEVTGTFWVNTSVGNDAGFFFVNKTNYITANPHGGGGGAAPHADFTGVPTSGPVPLAVTFTDTSNAFGATMWSWDFDGDGIPDAFTQNAVHTYTVAGIYTVTHSVSNASGTDTKTVPNYITVGQFSVDFSANVTTAPVPPLAVQFTATPTTSYVIDDWYWEFGDGNLDIVQNPVNVYNSAGSFTVNLRIRNVTGMLEYWRNKTNYINILDLNATLKVRGDVGDTWLKWDWRTNSTVNSTPTRPVDLYVDGSPAIANYTMPYYYLEGLDSNEEHRLEVRDNMTQVVLTRSTLRTLPNESTVVLILIFCMVLSLITIWVKDDKSVLITGLVGIVLASYGRSISYNYYGIDWVFLAVVFTMIYFVGRQALELVREKLKW